MLNPRDTALLSFFFLGCLIYVRCLRSSSKGRLDYTKTVRETQSILLELFDRQKQKERAPPETCERRRVGGGQDQILGGGTVMKTEISGHLISASHRRGAKRGLSATRPFGFRRTETRVLPLHPLASSTAP
jgi:hypothetical protein